MIPTFDELKDNYLANWKQMVVLKEPATYLNCKQILTGKPRYVSAQALTGVPWFVIAILHARESGVPPDWKACLHNGERIIGTGKKTHLVPAGRGPFAIWQDAAVDALELAGLDKINWHDGYGVEHISYALERFNGFGYRLYHKIPSTYLYGGTNLQHPGKYTGDGPGHWDPKAWDNQIGGMAYLHDLMRLDASVTFA